MAINSSIENVIEEQHYKVPKRRKVTKCVFSSMFSDFCDKLPRHNNRKIKTADIAKMLGLKPDYLKKVINMNRPTKNRDLIIAICAMLRLDTEETNEMLNVYNHMPALDFQANDREDLIITIIEEQFTNPLSLEQINEKLIRNGVEKLSITESRDAELVKLQNNTSYDVLDKLTKWISEYDVFKRDPYQSVETEYSPCLYTIVSEMVIENRENHQRFLLRATNDDKYEKWRLPIKKEETELINKNVEIELIDEPTADDEFYYFFKELQVLAHKEFKKKLSYLDDTKYFNNRIGAKILDNNLYVYMESYNFKVPELNEYYLMEFKDGRYIMSIYSSSVFLKKHLSSDDFEKYISHKKVKLKATYDSLSSLEDMKNDKSKSWNYRDMFSWRAGEYKRMMNQINDFIVELQNRKRYIRNLDFIYDGNSTKVLSYYDLTEQFHCTYNEYDEIDKYLPEIEWTSSDGKTVVLAFEDICKGFELGANDVEQICQIKLKYGEIWDIFQK